MTSDNWEELWKVYDDHKGGITLKHPWFSKVKAVGDELKSYNKTLDEVYTEACTEIVELQMKLEAIRNAIKKYEPQGYPEGHSFAFDEIVEVLGE